jgi:hypothetical protein
MESIQEAFLMLDVLGDKLENLSNFQKHALLLHAFNL